MTERSLGVFYVAFGVGLFLSSVLIFVQPVEAASLYIDPPTTTLYRGDAIKLSVRLDIDEASGECVNAVDGVLTYGPGVEPVDVSIGNSIFNIWVEKPTINREDNTITFAGGIPNGYCGRIDGDPRLTNVLAEVIFRSPGFSIGSADGGDETYVSFAPESTAYLNDGRGTKAPITTYGAKFTLEKRPSSTLSTPWKDEIEADVIPPQKFSIELNKDSLAFSQKYFIVFNTTDKETGIDQYQVIEEPILQLDSFTWGRANAPWIVVKSPYVLKDQTLNSVIRIKAIDKAGNEYVATYIPDKSIRLAKESGTPFTLIIGVALIILLLIAAMFTAIFHRRSKKLKIENGKVASGDFDTKGTETDLDNDHDSNA